MAKYATWVMMTYLTDVWGLSITKAASIVNIWNGIENLMQLVFAVLADEFMGKYLLLLLSSIAYSIFGIPALCTLLATLLFISGSRSYKTPAVNGSPLTNVFRVFVASASKIFQQLPDDDNQLYGKDDESARNLPYPGLRFLDKAAIISTTKFKEEPEKNKWMFCDVKEVEAAKKLVRMAPICATFVICGVVISVGNTYYVAQAKQLNRKLGRKGVMGLGAIGSVLSVYLVGKVSEMGGKPNWFQYTLNKSRLDHYYRTLAVLCVVNFSLYGLARYFYDLKVLLSDEPEKEVSMMQMYAEA
ncbi:hypothetical protein LguiA_029351 [Lonicera macranthoides]